MRLIFNVVRDKFIFQSKHVYELSTIYGRQATKYEKIKATANHPFYVQSKGFRRLSSCKKEDRLIALCSNQALVKNISIEPVKSCFVYDLTVENSHTFFVGSVGIWVHNSNYVNVIADVEMQPVSPLSSMSSPMDLNTMALSEPSARGVSFSFETANPITSNTSAYNYQNWHLERHRYDGRLYEDANRFLFFVDPLRQEAQHSLFMSDRRFRAYRLEKVTGEVIHDFYISGHLQGKEFNQLALSVYQHDQLQIVFDFQGNTDAPVILLVETQPRTGLHTLDFNSSSDHVGHTICTIYHCE